MTHPIRATSHRGASHVSAHLSTQAVIQDPPGRPLDVYMPHDNPQRVDGRPVLLDRVAALRSALRQLESGLNQPGKLGFPTRQLISRRQQMCDIGSYCSRLLTRVAQAHDQLADALPTQFPLNHQGHCVLTNLQQAGRTEQGERIGIGSHPSEGLSCCSVHQPTRDVHSTDSQIEHPELDKVRLDTHPRRCVNVHIPSAAQRQRRLQQERIVRQTQASSAAQRFDRQCPTQQKIQIVRRQPQVLKSIFVHGALKDSDQVPFVSRSHCERREIEWSRLEHRAAHVAEARDRQHQRQYELKQQPASCSWPSRPRPTDPDAQQAGQRDGDGGQRDQPSSHQDQSGSQAG